MAKIIQQISTHKAVKEDGKINIYVTGFTFEDLHFEDELVFPDVAEDDVFAIMERLEEDNRVNVAEFKNELA